MDGIYRLKDGKRKFINGAVVVKAHLWGTEPVPEWLNQAIKIGRAKYFADLLVVDGIPVRKGEWIINGVADDLFKLKAPVFFERYEKKDGV